MELSSLFKDEYCNAMGMLYEGPREFVLEVDSAGQAFVPAAVSSEVFAGRVVGDGNCFLGSFSEAIWDTGKCRVFS